MTHYDIALIGSGSGNSFPGPEFAGKSIVYIDRGVGPDRVFGGTCLNLGCIPTKMLVHTADIARTPADAARFGVSETLDGVDWPAIRDRIFGRIDPISAGGRAYREDHEDNANLTLLQGTARFTGKKSLTVDLEDGGTEEITAQTIVIGAGSRPVIPDVPGLADLDPLTSDTAMRIDRLPRSLAILGSGVIAAEFAHIFEALGVDVTIIARSDRLLRAADLAVSERFTRIAAERWRVVTGFSAARAERTEGGIRLNGTCEGSRGDGSPNENPGGELVIEAEELLVATGRRPNTDLLDAGAAGFDLHRGGALEVDAYQRVLAGGEPVEGVWAFGDISDRHQLKHVANHQQRIARHNILHPGALRRSDTMPVPAGIFSDPQVAMVGLTEEEARAQGLEIAVAVQDYAGVAYGWALEDTTSFAKIIAEKGSGRILGAHIIGPEATILIQQLIQAMSTGQSVSDIASTQYWIHPALPELIENALLQLTD